MQPDRLARLCAAAFILEAGPAAAGEIVLDLDAVLARAGEQAPASVAARGRIALAAAGRVGAGVRFADNPELEVEAGPRFGASTRAELSVQLGQTFALGGRRGARRAVAEAELARARVDAEAAGQDVRLAAALAFVRALHATRVVEVTAAASALATRAALAADRRRTAGDATDLDVDLAHAAAGRAAAAERTAEASRTDALAALAALCGLAAGDTIALRGELRSAPLTRADLAGGAEERVDLRAITAERVVADAEARLARAGARPSLGVWVGYAREEDADLVLAGLRLGLPVWDRGQGEHAVARARAADAAARHAVTARAIGREVEDAFAVYQQAQAAVAAFEADVLPRLDDAELLLGKGLEAGTLAIDDFLVARRELLDGRREHLDHLLALAEARLRALFAAGVSP